MASAKTYYRYIYMPMMAKEEKGITQLIQVRPFPAVVQAADVAALRQYEQNDPRLRDFVGGYLGFDERSRYALSTLLRSLIRADRGGGFFLNGVFGSGKSHLLGLLALLCDGRGHNFFAATHPPLASQLTDLPSRLVIHFSLDNYDSARFSLEEIFWREVQAEWRRQGLPASMLTEVMSEAGGGSRAEQFAALDEALARYHRSGIVLCADELSLFLSAKGHKELQADAAFLQFLGQRAMRAPLWCIFALQKTMEDVGELEEYSLSQIRDRFTLLPLSLAHIPALIEHRLIQKKDAAAIQHVCHQSYDTLNAALPRLDFGRREWQELYPFYPATIALLEQTVSRFFSRTRSAALFCSQSASTLASQSEDAAARVLPEALWDYLEPELGEHPDLRPLAAVWDDWQDALPELSHDDTDTRFLTKLMKGLLLFKIAGTSPSVAQLANAVAFDAKLPNEANYEYAQVLLERLRGQGSHLAVERHDEPFGDRYAVDAGTRVGEAARRHTRNALSTLPLHDARLTAFAVACSRDEPLPLASIQSTPAFPILWRNGPRYFAVELWTKNLTPQTIANRVAMLAQPGSEEDALLIIVPPFAEAADFSPHDIAPLLEDARWRGALIVWKPRAATDSERETAREALAAHLLEDDPQLLDNRRGRAVLEHLKAQASQRETMLSRTAARLLREGELSNGHGETIEAAELAGGENWTSTLEAVAEWALPAVFPRFEEVAPRLRVLTPSNADALCLEILRRPSDEPFFGPSLERAARAIAEPLGIAQSASGRWRIGALRGDLKEFLLQFIGEGATLLAVQAHAAKCEWGLRIEQTNIAICALLRSGDLAATDSRGQILPPSSLGMPLRRSVHALRPGQLLDEELWPRVADLVSLLAGEELSERSFAAQEQARRLLTVWRDETQAEAELFQSRLRQLQKQLGHAPAQWQQTQSTLEQLATLLAKLGDGEKDLLYSAAHLEAQDFAPVWAHWSTLREQLETRHTALMAAHGLLAHSDLVAPPDLQTPRVALLERLNGGEEVLNDASLPADAGNWRVEYATRYRSWHEAQHAPARWNALRRLAHSDELRALKRLGELQNRSFPQGDILQKALAEELSKACPRDGSLRADEAVCSHCRLRLDERLRLRDASELETMLAQGIAAFYGALQEESVHDYLSHAHADALQEWNGEAETLPSLLDDDTLQLLNEAFRPRRRVARSWNALQSTLAQCRTRADYEVAFAAWLDGEDRPANDDEIDISD